MGPIERELRDAAELGRAGSGTPDGEPYEFWFTLSMMRLSEAAADLVVPVGGEATEDLWTDAIEAAEALGL